VLSAACAAEPVGSLMERWVRGWEVMLPGVEADGAAGEPEVHFAAKEETSVAVAGTGTAGALAALAAARHGAAVIALDAAASPGGIGTNGGITGYFHGVPGGMQAGVDEKVNEMSYLLTGKRY